MDSRDKKLKRDLSGDPLIRSGFNERLRRRIEERLDEKPAGRGGRMFRLGGAGAGMLVLTAILVMLVQLQTGQRAVNERPEAADGNAAEFEVRIASPGEGAAGNRSALLIALRTDDDGGDPYESMYRTVLVTTEGGEPVVRAEGAGILMPYKTDFWRIVTAASDDSGGSYRTITAYNTSLADRQAAPLLKNDRDTTRYDDVKEKVVFAGNRYVAIARQSAGKESMWVMDILQLGEPRALSLLAGNAEPHAAAVVTEEGRLGAVSSEETPREGKSKGLIHNWTIARSPGEWVAYRASGDGPVKLAELPYKLNRDVYGSQAQDALTIGWDEIRSVEPAARDAFTSPNGNLAAIVTDRSLMLQGADNGEFNGHVAEVPLKAGEQVVMAQWATGSGYVERWKEKAAGLLKDGRD